MVQMCLCVNKARFTTFISYVPVCPFPVRRLLPSGLALRRYVPTRSLRLPPLTLEHPSVPSFPSLDERAVSQWLWTHLPPDQKFPPIRTRMRKFEQFTDKHTQADCLLQVRKYTHIHINIHACIVNTV